jgi:hypothetical protein
MGKHFKILGLSLLALVGVMAVSATAAQAKWLLLKSGVSVKLLEVTASAGLGFLLVPKLGLQIHCTAGSGTVHVESSEEDKKLLVKATPVFTGCTDKKFGGVCTVRGASDTTGKITAKGKGEGSMSGEKVLITAASGAGEAFTDVKYEGEECPLTEIDGKVTGSVTFEVGTPLTDSTSHGVTVTAQSLLFGGQTSELHKTKAGEALTGTVSSGSTFAVHLVSL